MKRLQVNLTILERNDPNMFVTAMVDAMRRQNFPIPSKERIMSMVDPAREFALYIRDELGLKNCQLVHLEGTMPPEATCVFVDEIPEYEK
jgi:hypothetical protein